ncbi:MAG: hypothetical protein NT031_04780 [Planctomycetota bacterium]|nr:hypothetical protein [Planctomycetota bacterium]
MVDLNVEAQARPSGHRGRGGDAKKVVVLGPAEVFHVRFGQGQQQASLFHLGVRYADLAEQFGAATLEPLQRAGVVERAHLIGFAVSHAKSGDVGGGSSHGSEGFTMVDEESKSK